jgi:hypothetical protein
MWHIYPFDIKMATCFSSKEKGDDIMSDFYFNRLSSYSMFGIVQGGKEKGEKKLRSLNYNLQDSKFWDSCWIWQKDTVGSNNLYPFELSGYYYYGKPCDKSCGDPYNPPVITYPKEILALYTKSH